MPELPEVTTTVLGINKVLKGLSISDAWTDWQKMIHYRPFSSFRKKIIGKKFLKAERRGKNILIHFSNSVTILIHMKMTGHLLYGAYKTINKKQLTINKKRRDAKTWVPVEEEKNKALSDPYNRFIHVVFSLSNGKQLVFCDSRKFGKIDLLDSKNLHQSKHLVHLGPEPLPKSFDFKTFRERLSKKPRGKIKTVLMDQSVIAGIGNIYSDEILWRAGVHPEERVEKLPEKILQKIFSGIKPLLSKGIDSGGDSTSDYRNIHGERGKFQGKHEAYGRKNEKCRKKGCHGIILRKVVNGRSAHFCSVHQKPVFSQFPNFLPI
ncbi:MAG: bifunctional DNA-formamidopyrimidine glycosylase/DNA-(apurinic or apyrimidinic site) lyase [bacterium]|nr:bifunctional DNA-formamidopyrimidine glycosylase/DNA-(apurinic or apyrimidinic site) lyase [bacterium]